MKNLQEATERICELKGSLVALDALVPAVIDALSPSARARLIASFDAHAEAARTVMLHADISDVVLATFERDVARDRAILVDAQDDGRPSPATPTPAPAIDGLLLATTRIAPFAGARPLPGATGFFFRRGARLFLVTDRLVFAGAAGSPSPDRVEIGLHVDLDDLSRRALLSLPLLRGGVAQWREAPPAEDGAGVALLEIAVATLPPGIAPPAFEAMHLEARGEEVAVGDPLTIVGFPARLDDTLHHLPVARGASVASAFGVRYRGGACFLTDARLLPGCIGSPVVRRRLRPAAAAPSPSWQLLGVQSDGPGPGAGEAAGDGAPGLHRAWYADALLALTAAA